MLSLKVDIVQGLPSISPCLGLTSTRGFGVKSFRPPATPSELSGVEWSVSWLPQEEVEDSDSEEDSDCQLVGPRDGQEESSGHIVFDSASAGVSRGKSVKWQEEQVIHLSVLYPTPGTLGTPRCDFWKRSHVDNSEKKLN